MKAYDRLEVTPSAVRAPDDAWSRNLLRQMFKSAVAAADPALVLPHHLPPQPQGRCVVVGAGKAAASMAAAVEAAWPEADLSGCVVVPHGYELDCRQIRVLEAGHPVPDAHSVAAAKHILSAVQGLGPDDLVLALISGGGSAVMCLPAAGVTLEDKQVTNRLLLKSGLDIRLMNAVRRRISAIKGGRLAEAAAPARVVTLAISDIPGDDPAAIASGPTAPARGQAPELDQVVEMLGPQLPQSVKALLAQPGTAISTDNAEPVRIVATAGDALAAAAKVARDNGLEPVILGDAIEGEARVVAQEMARRVLDHSGPTILLSGGETTVTVGGGQAGRGGRNTEFLLALVSALDGRAGVWAIAADTDGEDGANFGAAGAIAGPDTLQRAQSVGLDAAAALASHDSGSFFAALDDLIVTGPTLTNVNDFRAILIMPPERG